MRMANGPQGMRLQRIKDPEAAALTEPREQSIGGRASIPRHQALLLSAHGRAPWIRDILAWTGGLHGRAISISAEAVCAPWLQQNLWVLRSVAPRARLLIIEDVFAGDMASTADFLRHVRKERADLLIMGVFRTGGGQETAGDCAGLCDVAFELPGTRDKFHEALREAERRATLSEGT